MDLALLRGWWVLAVGIPLNEQSFALGFLMHYVNHFSRDFPSAFGLAGSHVKMSLQAMLK